MKLAAFAVALALAACAAPAAKAAEGKALELRPKAAFAAALPGSSAPFAAAAPVPHLDFAPREVVHEANPSSCENGHLVCYDGANGGHLVFKPARRLMPDIPGLRAENLTVKRDRIVLHYSFW